MTTDEVTKRMGGDFVGDTFTTDPKSSGAPRAQQEQNGVLGALGVYFLVADYEKTSQS